MTKNLHTAVKKLVDNIEVYPEKYMADLAIFRETKIPVSKGIFEQMNEQMKKGKFNVVDNFVGKKVFDSICQHIYQKSEPSRVDEHYTLIWVCCRCGKEVCSM